MSELKKENKTYEQELAKKVADRQSEEQLYQRSLKYRDYIVQYAVRDGWDLNKPVNEDNNTLLIAEAWQDGYEEAAAEIRAELENRIRELERENNELENWNCELMEKRDDH